jgi:CheY-like chemotaxis protein
VLVVDDEEAIRQVVAMTLEDEGYVVTTAAHGQEALAQVLQARPDLVLLDLHMPVMDGWAFCAELKRRELIIPIVFMTAGARARDEAARAGVAGSLAKPFNLDVLLDTVARFQPAAR